MIKPHCSHCNSLYLDDLCPCRNGRKPARLECECGQPAHEIVVDRLGEWPLCRACLALELDEFAPLPLPDFSAEDVPELFEDPPPEPDPLPPLEDLPGKIPPCGLTPRQYQVACLTYLPNQLIADRLSIAKATVHTHMERIYRKLQVSDRQAIIPILQGGILAADTTSANPAKNSTQPATPLAVQAPTTLSLTISGSVDSLQDVLEKLVGGSKP